MTSYDVPPELEVPLDLDDVLVRAAVLLADFQDSDLELELLIELCTHFKYLQRVVPVILVVQHLQNLQSTRSTFPNAPDPRIFRI